MKRQRPVTATEVSECCWCEQRIVLDRLRGKRRSAEAWREMAAGTAAHAELHLAAVNGKAGDHRCFIATAVWGMRDERTMALRAWRDASLLTRWWGRIAVQLYYGVSPSLAALVVKVPPLRDALDRLLTSLVCRLSRRSDRSR